MTDSDPSRQIMGMYAKNDVGFDDMVDGSCECVYITCRNEREVCSEERRRLFRVRRFDLAKMFT